MFIFILTLALVYYSVNYVSVFSLLSDSKESIEGLNSDTRTFLWVEFFSDFGNTDLYTQLFGKGCLGYYASDFFRTNHRFGIEVPILQWILQAGWLYIIFLTTIMVTAVVRLCKYGQNKMCLISATLIAGLYFNMYVSNLIGCNLSTIGTWFLIGMAFNDCFLHISDNDLKVQIYDV